jgi:hypothetical protein
VLTIPGNSFHPTGDGTNEDCIPDTTGGTSGAGLYTPVELPDGVTVTKLTFYWWDSSAGTDATVTLTRTPLPASSGPFPMATASSSGSAGVHTSSSTNTITNPTIDNADFMYYVKAVIATSNQQCIDAVQLAYSG